MKATIYITPIPVIGSKTEIVQIRWTTTHGTCGPRDTKYAQANMVDDLVKVYKQALFAQDCISVNIIDDRSTK